MSEAEEGRPLSRRERRLLEMAEAEALSETLAPTVAETTSTVEVDEPADDADIDFEPQIDPLNPDGTERTRREIRELREQAIAERREARLLQTQAFTVADLEDALSAEAVEADKAADALEAEAEVEAANADVEEVDELAALFAEDADERVEAEAEAVEELRIEDAEAEPDAEAAADAEEAGEDPVADEEPEAGADDESEDEQHEATAEPVKGTGYSFPDIAPLDEPGSVFDDPAVRGAARTEGAGDFDDLITRAVEQETAGHTASGTSALILPNMGHTGQLSGPLGETGELFITGSVDLPKSLGETGGHAGLIDAVDDDDDFALGTQPAREDSGGIAPVSAANAVSARSNAAVVAKPEKEKSRLPVVLIATGGGLLAVIAGLAVWAMNSGFFS